MITRREGDLFVIVNAACKAADITHLRGPRSAANCEIVPLVRPRPCSPCKAPRP